MASCRTSSTRTIAEAVGAAFVEVTGAEPAVWRTTCASRPGRWPPPSPGARVAQGADVVNAGLGSTDLLYYASGSLGPARRDVHRQPQPGPLQRHQAVPRRAPCRSASDTGLTEIRDRAAEACSAPRRRRPGRDRAEDLLPGYAEHLRTLVDLSGIRPLKVVVDAGNGMGGHTVPAVFEGLPIDAGRRSTSSSTAPSPTTRPTRWSPPTCVDLQTAVREHRRRHRAGLRRRRRPVLGGRRARRVRSPRRRSPRWSRCASWPSTRARRSSTT